MLKILPITLQKLKNASHKAFMSEVKSLLESENMASHGMEKVIEPFNLAIQAEEDAGRVRRKSFITDELVKQNAQREELYAGLTHHYESCLRHYDTAMRNAAHYISIHIKSIAYMHNCSNPIRTVRISLLIERLRSLKNTESLELLQISGWLNALENLNETYNNTWMDRISESSQRGNGNVRKARMVTDKVYQDVVWRVNALMTINEPEEYERFVRLLNVNIAREKKSIAIREGWRKHKKTVKAEKEKLDEANEMNQ